MKYVTQSLRVILLGCLLISAFLAFNRYKYSQYFPIKVVRVYGANRVDPQEMRDLLRPLVNRSFFTVNVEYIRDRLLQMPWVANMVVERRWPDQVDVIIIEKKAMARWNEHSLLSAAGELFSPKPETYPAALPQFIGPEGQQVVMLDYFNQMNRLLMPLHAKISYLEMTAYFTWKLKLDNGIVLQIGHKDILTRLDHFVKVYPKIIGNRIEDVEYIDLRYPNGMAVRWKTKVEV